jgi:MFS family permease
MNTLGNLGGLLGPLVVGIAVDRWHSWTFPFYVTAIIYAFGACAWLAIDPTMPLARPDLGLPRPGSAHLDSRGTSIRPV